VIDHQKIERRLCLFQLEPKLFLHHRHRTRQRMVLAVDRIDLRVRDIAGRSRGAFEWIYGDHFWRRRWDWRSLANGKCQFALSLAISPDVFGEAVGAGETANGFPVVTSIEQAEDFNLAILLQAVGAHF
jgi:hypothetical protein